MAASLPNEAFSEQIEPHLGGDLEALACGTASYCLPTRGGA